MNAESNSLSSGPLYYFLIHSGAFVLITASIFFVLGLAFGWLTWSRHRRAARRLREELEGKKDEIALLKRTLAEHTSRLTPESEAENESRSANRYLNQPDLVLGSFLTTASSLLPEPESGPDSPAPPSIPSHIAAPEVVIRPSKKHSAMKPQPITASKAPATDSKPQHVLKSVIVGAPPTPAQEPPAPIETPLKISDPSESVGALNVPAAEASAPVENPPTPATSQENKPTVTEAHSPETVRLVSDPHLGLVFRARPHVVDDLTQLKGVASGIESRLNELGVYTFKQIALWSDENIVEFARLLSFKDRIQREHWVDQSRELHYHTYNERV